MRILLLGATGQVGFELQRSLAPLGELICSTRTGKLTGGFPAVTIDLSNTAALKTALESIQPDIIVNAAAYTAVDSAEDESALAERINHHAIAEIGAWARIRDVLVIHYSTDYVFDGYAKQPYREEDPTGPLGVYGYTKLAGEQALSASGCAHLTLRTTWVYAARGHSFLRTMLRLASEREELRIVNDQIGSPTSARCIAATTSALLAQWLPMNSAARKSANGIYHLSAAGQCSWFEFTVAIMQDSLTAGLLTRAPRVLSITTTDYPTRAQRPAWSVLDCRKLERTFGLYLPDWRQSLQAVLGELSELATIHTPY